MSESPVPPASARDLLRHTVSTLAYRAEKVLREVPAPFADHRIGAASRTPMEILDHLGDLVEWGDRMARGEYKWEPQQSGTWQAACDRFFNGLSAFDRSLEQSTFERHSADQIFQGPVADALTHIGQLALIRGIVGGPVRPESYAGAEIRLGRVGREQSSVRKEFDGDASRRNRQNVRQS